MDFSHNSTKLQNNTLDVLTEQMTYHMDRNGAFKPFKPFKPPCHLCLQRPGLGCPPRVSTFEGFGAYTRKNSVATLLLGFDLPGLTLSELKLGCTCAQLRDSYLSLNFVKLECAKSLLMLHCFAATGVGRAEKVLVNMSMTNQ